MKMFVEAPAIYLYPGHVDFRKSINGLNQYGYLHALLTELKSPDAEIDWEALLPWKITLP